MDVAVYQITNYFGHILVTTVIGNTQTQTCLVHFVFIFLGKNLPWAELYLFCYVKRKMTGDH